MARVAGVNIPDGKTVPFSLCYIYGIGFARARQICVEQNLDPLKRVRDLTDNELRALRAGVDKYQVEGDLRRTCAMNIKLKVDIGCYEGKRHRLKLPVRGQNTHSNAKTRKGRGAAIANKKMPTK